MALTFVKFNCFTTDLGLKKHAFGTDTYKLALSNTLPVSSQAVFDAVTNHPPPANVNGYTTGGETVTNLQITNSTGSTAKVDQSSAAPVVFTATSGGIGPFRYLILYNTAGTKPLVAYYDYGSSITLNDTETFTATFDAVNGALKLD